MEPDGQPRAPGSPPRVRRRLFAGWLAVAAAGAGILIALAVVILLLR